MAARSSGGISSTEQTVTTSVAQSPQGWPVCSASAAIPLSLFVFQRRGSGPPIDFHAPRAAEKQARPRTMVEARHWPPEKVGELVDRLTEELHTLDPDSEDAWRQEARRRVAEIENGTVQAVEGEEVSARIGRIVGR
jgi:hypothetical protein